MDGELSGARLSTAGETAQAGSRPRAKLRPMLDRLTAVFPFAIALVLPPAGALIGIFALDKDREFGIRMIAVAALAAVLWILLVF
jgi:hypothetical protein